MLTPEGKVSQASQLNALRALHKMKKKDEDINRDESDGPKDSDKKLNKPIENAAASAPKDITKLDVNKQAHQPPTKETTGKHKDPSRQESSNYPATDMSVKNTSTSQKFTISEQQQIKDRSELKKSSPPRQEKRDISITLSAYNVHLKRAEDKEFYKMREEFSNALVKLESLDTRDLVEISNSRESRMRRR